MIARPSSRFSRRQSTSRPVSFQSIALNQLKKRHPRSSLTTRAAGCHCSGDTRTVTTPASRAGSTPHRERRTSTAWAAVTRSVLGGASGPRPGVLELRDLLLKPQESIHEGVGGGWTPGHV